MIMIKCAQRSNC